MRQKKNVFQKQFESSLHLTEWSLLLCGIKLSRKSYRNFIEYFINNYLLYLNFIILHSVIFGEIYGVVDCIQTGKSLVELSFNLPCITVSILATSKVFILYLKRDILIKLYYRLKEIHCEIQNSIDFAGNEHQIILSSVKVLKTFVYLILILFIAVQVTFYLVPICLIAYKYIKTGELVIMYPFLVKYPLFDIMKTSWWPLIYFHQAVATVATTCMIFGCDTLFCALCSYIDLYFRLLGVKFQNTVTSSKEETNRNLKNNIRTHQELIELVNQMETIFSKSILFHIVAASFLICLSAFIITITDELNIQFAYFTFLAMSLAQISLICYFADMLTRSSTQISESVYNCSWYESDTSVKKSILLVMLRSQKACKLTAWKFAVLDLRMFTKILSTSWSYFALLRTMYK